MARSKTPKIIGIYHIRNKINGKIYIGQSKDMKSRWGKHLSELRLNRHDNPHLQSSYNMYGEDAFEFILIGEYDVNLLVEKEQEELDKYSDVEIYNVCRVVEGAFGDKNPNFGRKQSLETKLKLRANRKTKIKAEDIPLIVEKLKNGEARKGIAKEYGVTTSNITMIAIGRSWTHITGGVVIPSLRDENGRLKITDSHKEALSKFTTSRVYRRGFSHSEETKEKMSKTRKEMFEKFKADPEWRSRVISEEEKQNRSEAQLQRYERERLAGKPKKVWTEEEKKNIAEGVRKASETRHRKAEEAKLKEGN